MIFRGKITKIIRIFKLLTFKINYRKTRSDISKKHKLLLDLSLLLVNCNDKESLYKTCLEQIQKGLGYDNAYLLLKRSPKEKMRLVAYKGEEVDEKNLDWVVEHEIGLTGKAIRLKKAIVSNDVKNDPFYVESNRKTLSEMVIPVICEGITWGVLIIDSHQKWAFNKTDSRIMQIFCNYLSSILTRLNDYEKVKYKSEMESIILDIVTEASRENLIEEICRNVVEKLSRRTNYTPVYILKATDETKGNSRLIAGSGPGAFDDLHQIEEGLGLVGKTIRNKKTLYCPDVYQEPDYLMIEKETRSELDVPITYGDRIYGVLSLENHKLDGFDQGDKELMEILAKHLGVLWAYSDLLTKTQREALKDPLTGLWNRKHFYECLQKEIDRHKRQNDSFCIVMIDLGDFKAISDIYGHTEGDRVLVEVGNFLLKRIRSSDLLARYGGDEFIVLLPHTEVETAQSAWKRLASEVLNYHFGEHAIKVDLDFGVASYPKDAIHPQDIIRIADSQLYAQKKRRKAVC